MDRTNYVWTMIGYVLCIGYVVSLRENECLDVKPPQDRLFPRWSIDFRCDGNQTTIQPSHRAIFTCFSSEIFRRIRTLQPRYWNEYIVCLICVYLNLYISIYWKWSPNGDNIVVNGHGSSTGKEINRCWAGGKILRCRIDPATSWGARVVGLRRSSSSGARGGNPGGPSLWPSTFLADGRESIQGSHPDD